MPAPETVTDGRRSLTRKGTAMLGKLIAVIFLAAVALVPVAIVAFWHRMGAIWVTGYVVGIVTVPLVGIGALRATSAMFEETNAFIAFIAFGCSAIAISLAAALYAFIH